MQIAAWHVGGLHRKMTEESRAAYYREQGRQIRALVSLVIHPEVKAELELAEQFERLAEMADHRME